MLKSLSWDDRIDQIDKGVQGKYDGLNAFASFNTRPIVSISIVDDIVLGVCYLVDLLIVPKVRYTTLFLNVVAALAITTLGIKNEASQAE